MIERHREIASRVNERYLVTEGDRWADRDDAFYHADLHRLRDLVIATDASMAAEGVSEDVRDRVVFRLLHGEPPEAFKAPDWREAANRADDREREMLRLMRETGPPRHEGSCALVMAPQYVADAYRESQAT